MVTRIIAGDFENNFFAGELLKGEAANEKEEVGACLLDKVGAIVTEGGVEQFLNDLQVDAAACCTKDRKDCVADITEAYALLTSVRETHGINFRSFVQAVSEPCRSFALVTSPQFPWHGM